MWTDCAFCLCLGTNDKVHRWTFRTMTDTQLLLGHQVEAMMILCICCWVQVSQHTHTLKQKRNSLYGPYSYPDSIHFLSFMSINSQCNFSLSRQWSFLFIGNISLFFVLEVKGDWFFFLLLLPILTLEKMLSLTFGTIVEPQRSWRHPLMAILMLWVYC